ncbi:major capsid protein [Mesorhizobium sp. M8A.F.Ca.ET.021.01.1.1]|uniref:major capsid protein n=1 Tax=Mesorhizobium sp. M8A.F.Ca.ET.021.01.1.1 TaxID=2496757 RepID=UPI000FCC8AD1|nr:hypothetical protein [Mesorhizobium sp. M8A.F.Ca.ET.021.01.1.1]RUW56729.1 hypothetical protein EOA36_02780 [Mesorhizobium sp. M8A.F.Ca.ET.021.01.1.1]
MPVTLLEASKLVSGDVKRSTIIEMFPRNSDLLAAMPFIDVPGGAYVYNREGKLPGVAFRGFNEGYTESTGVINPESEILRIAGGELDVDTAIIKTRGRGVRSSQEAMKVKAKALYLADKLMNGDSEADPREFDGLRKRITGAQLFQPTSAQNVAGALSLEVLDAAIDAVDNPTHLVMSKALRRKLTKAARDQKGGEITYTVDAFGRQVTQYNDLPILMPDVNDLGQRIIDFNETGIDSTANTTSLYVVSLGEDKIVGLQNGIMEVKDLGELESKPALRTRVEWLVGLAVMHGRAAARIASITSADFTG